MRSRLRALPWLALLRASVVIGERWRSLSDRERTRLVSLVRSSRGWPGRLSSSERVELGRLARELQLKAVVADLTVASRGRRRGRRRR